MERVRKLLQQPLIAVDSDATISDAVRIMRGNAVDCLPVLRDGEIVGVFTARRLVAALAETGAEALQCAVERFMDKEASAAAPDARGEDAGGAGGESAFRPAVVEAPGRPLGAPLYDCKAWSAAAELDDRNRQLAGEIRERKRVEKELREKTRFLETVLDTIQDGISVLDTDYNILKLNNTMCAWYGPEADQKGKKCYEAYHGRSAICDNCPSVRALSDGKMHVEIVPKTIRGEQVGWLELYAYPFFDADGEMGGLVEFVRDVTERKKLEGEFIEAVERAEAANKAKTGFLAGMSHEIRTPLNAVQGYIQLVLRGELEPRQRERLIIAEESAGTLLGVINDVLDYSRIEAGKFELREECFDLRRLLHTLVKEQDVLAERKGVELSLSVDEDTPSRLVGDPLRLRQVLRNLVNNAVKYTPAGRVEVNVAATPGAAPIGPDASPNAAGASPLKNGTSARTRLLFTVFDTGLGISEEDQERIFDSFTRAETGPAGRQIGSGLGLAICRKIAELLGGAMWFESEEGRGSAFYFTASFAAAGDEPEEKSACLFEVPKEEKESSPLNVLLAEDNIINQLFAADLLQSRGHNVVVAENGARALEKLRGGTFDVALMDIQMPVMSGVDAVRAIRAHDGSDFDPDMPVVGLSAFAMDQERERFMAEGLDGYIAKPINVDEFFKTLAEVLERKQGGKAPGRDGAGGPAGAPVLNTAALYAQYREKTRLLEKVGREFAARAPEYLESMRTALASGDLETCAGFAHNLKGNASMFGAEALRDRAHEAERAAVSGDAVRLGPLVEALESDLESALAALKEFMGRLNAARC